MAALDLEPLVAAIAEQVAARLEARGIPAAGGPEPWIGVDQAADHLAAPRSRIYELVERDVLPHARDGRRLLFRRSQLDAYLARQVDERRGGE